MHRCITRLVGLACSSTLALALALTATSAHGLSTTEPTADLAARSMAAQVLTFKAKRQPVLTMQEAKKRLAGTPRSFRSFVVKRNRAAVGTVKPRYVVHAYTTGYAFTTESRGPRAGGASGAAVVRRTASGWRPVLRWSAAPDCSDLRKHDVPSAVLTGPGASTPFQCLSYGPSGETQVEVYINP